MKRNFLFATMLLLAVAACKKDEINGGDGTTPEPGTTYTLEGTVAADGFTWKSGAELSMYSATDGVRIQNAKCAIAADGAGQATARFTTPGIDLVAGENRLALLYPSSTTALYTSERFSNLTLADQTVAAPGAAADYVAAGYATGTPGTDETFGFELTPVTAVAEVRIGTSMSEYVGSKVNKVTLQNSASVPVAGMYIINAGTEVALQPADQNTSTSVAATVSAPEALASGSVQSIPVTLFPADFTGKELSVMIDMTDAEGTAASITVKVTDLVFTAGQTTVIDLSDITSGDIEAEDWYCNDDTRLLPGLGYAYGQANTFIIQCKNGSTYTGGTYSPNDNIPDEVVIDYRIRGNRANITDDMIPNNVTFEWFKKQDGTIYTPRPQSLAAGGITIDESSFTFTQDPDNYTVTVKNNNAYAGSPILVMKNSAGEILWAWAFWNVAADGTTLDPVTVGSYQFAPMDLGQPTNNAETWANTGGLLCMYSANLLYQWGRPFPVLWMSQWTLNTNVPIVYGPMSLAESLHNVGMIYSESAMKNWCTETHTDLWGAAVADDPNSVEGKTIYDPCPEGYRIASTAAMEAFINASPSYSVENTANVATASGLKVFGNGYVTSVKFTDDGRPQNMQFQAVNANRAWYWTNSGGEEQAATLFIDYRTSGTEEPQTARLGSNDLSNVMSVRCIVDTDNR